jgi:hypothetical protein
MAKSESQAQAELLTEGWIDRQAVEKVDRTGGSGTPTIEELLARYANEFVQAIKDNLNSAGKISTGGLSDGVDSGEILKYKGMYILEIGYDKNDPSAKYWDFVNKGVKGLVSGEPANSPYKFRKLSAPPVMVEAIKGWLRQNGITPTANESQKTNLSALQQKRKSIAAVQDPLDSFAYFTARKIKREGLPYTGYFDKPVAEYFGDNFAEAVAKAAAFDIRIAIRKFNPAQNA